MRRMNLRPATMEDAALLLEWRNEPSTRKWFHNPDAVQKADHFAWLEKVIADPNRLLYIAEVDGRPVGSIRADFDGTAYELSWSIAASARNAGYGKAMTAMMVDKLSGQVVAEVLSGNTASFLVAEHAGLKRCEEVNGVVHFRRYL